MRPLVQIFVTLDGAVLCCSYCDARQAVRTGLASEVLGFQEEHFDCDPDVRPPGTELPAQRRAAQACAGPPGGPEARAAEHGVSRLP
ncbi:MAG: hypothetical protein QOE05_298 [Actinomycetota bacterium]|nr:hypothetical protein [Actinomycetota bacterium]